MPETKAAPRPISCAEADAFRDARRWSEAAEAYASILESQSSNAGLWVQYGHALKESGKTEAAVEAYRRALVLEPRDWDIFLQLGHALKKLGRSQEALEAYTQAHILEPGSDQPVRELIGLGARERVESFRAEAQSAVFAMAAEIREMRSKLDRWEKLLPDLLSFSAVPASHYAEFRRQFDLVQDPPGVDPGKAIACRVFAFECAPASLKRTIDSLIGQRHANWRAEILVDPDLSNQAAVHLHDDARIAFSKSARGEFSEGPRPADGDLMVCCRAGFVLDPRAFGWIRAVHDEVGCGAAYSDFDHIVDAGAEGTRRSDPALNGAFDLDLLLQTDSMTELVSFRADCWREGVARCDPTLPYRDWLRQMLIVTSRTQTIAAIPRVLGGVDVDRFGQNGDPEAAFPSDAFFSRIEELGAPRLEQLPLAQDGANRSLRWTSRDQDERVTVVIPTKDRLDLLRPCVESLRALSSRLQNVEILVVDNGSAEEATLAYLDLGRRENILSVLRVEEPFNWSRLCNAGARRADAGILLFLNNDTVMLTREWDDILLGFIQRPDVGAVGARLLYPDMEIQHAGICFGMNGWPEHEGRRRPTQDQGARGRLGRSHAAAAVTGAFLAVRKSAFDAVGGFDDQEFPLAFNDIDFCLKIRERGGKIMYAPLITLIHYESASLGDNSGSRKMAWNQLEWTILRRRWETALSFDPTLNPYWCGGAMPMEGLAAPSSDKLWSWIRAAARENPFSAAREADARSSAAGRVGNGAR